jgi:hypothetical protein
MARKQQLDKIKGQFFPVRYEVWTSPAWRQLSMGARVLYLALKKRVNKNNGHVYLSQRDAEEELGHKDRNDIANWFRELQHYGFIVKTVAASLGVDGKGKAAHWRLTELPTRNGRGERDLETNDFLHWNGVLFEPHVRPSRRWNKDKQATMKKQNPGRHVATTVDGTSPPRVDGTLPPLAPGSGGNVTPIQPRLTGGNVTPISRLATRFGCVSFPCCQHRLRDRRAEAAE